VARRRFHFAGPGTSAYAVLPAPLYAMSVPLIELARGQGVLEVDVTVHKVLILEISETAAS